MPDVEPMPESEPQDAAGKIAAARRAAGKVPSRAPASDSAEEVLEDVVAQGGRAVLASKSPLLTILALVISALIGGGGFKFGTDAAARADIQFAELAKKFDKLTEELAETRKAVDAMRSEGNAALARAQAERHEERIRDLEKAAQASTLERQQLRIELEALKKGK